MIIINNNNNKKQWLLPPFVMISLGYVKRNQDWDQNEMAS